ncbi:hypothetical protein [Hymenobacter coccineus]|nr:hypothetical protein [Hymenobacter coccineus]
MRGDRRLEGDVYLTSGYGVRLALETQPAGWVPLGQLARVWQPGRLKGIQVGPQYGTPFLAATQVFDLRPVPRKFLALERTSDATNRFLQTGTIVVTCSGNVGRTVLSLDTHEGILISHDLLRVVPFEEAQWGWIYSYLRTPQGRAMMNAAQYGHVIKHLEVAHLEALPVPKVTVALAAHFTEQVNAVVAMRNRAHALVTEAEGLFAQAIGPIEQSADPETGFSVSLKQMGGKRLRLEATFYTPHSSAVLRRFAEVGRTVEPLSQVAEKVWWITRFKRVFGEGGVPYMSADEIFAQNATITKKVLVDHENAGDTAEYHVKAGWLVMACSGQIYGLNGSVALMTKNHEKAFFSHDLIRIIPKLDTIRPGYLFAALSHPTLGRPLVKRYAYGTSIPHIEPADVATFPVVRLDETTENTIADRMEEATSLRAEADMLENHLAAEAEALLDRFIAGERLDEFSS